MAGLLKLLKKRTIAADKQKVREPFFETLFVRYGAGSNFLRRFTSGKIWNFVAWALIVLFTIAWILFLRWDPLA